MTPRSISVNDEAQIRKILDNWAEAIRAKDSHALVSGFAPHVLMFDLIKPLQYVGSMAVRKRAEEWLSSFQGPIGYEVRDLQITTGGDVAFCHSLNRVNATNKSGDKIDMWWRATVCFRKVEGNWVVAHEHCSVPFDMQSGQAALDLQP